MNDTIDNEIKNIPKFLLKNLDLVGQHKTIDDLRYMVRHEIDLYLEGEESSIKTLHQYKVAKLYLTSLPSKKG